MLQPAPTTKIAPDLARGTLVEIPDAGAERPSLIVVTFPNTSYQIHLRPTDPVRVEPGKRVVGRIRAEARRVDVVRSGGRFIEPAWGRPRRVQGVVVAADGASGTITVNAGVPLICRLTDARQKPGDFEPGDFVSFDVLPGATFAPEG